MKRKLLSLVLAAGLAAGLAACGNTEEPANADAKDGAGKETEAEMGGQPDAEEESKEAWVGGYACHSANDFFDAIEFGLNEAAALSNGSIIRADSELATSSEIAIIENFISQKVDVIFLTPDDPSGSIEGVKLANEIGRAHV